MSAVHVTVWDDRDGGQGAAHSYAAPALFVHNIFAWGSGSAYGFAGQRPLADSRRLLLMDRRGYGDSPDTARSDFGVDAEDVVDILDDGGNGGTHLVGHGNGAVVALLAAARRAGLVRSLALLQPSAFTAAVDRPAVAGLLARVRDGAPGVPEDITPQQYLRASTEGLGMPAPDPTPRRLRAVATAMRERPVWEAEIPLAPIRDAAPAGSGGLRHLGAGTCGVPRARGAPSDGRGGVPHRLPRGPSPAGARVLPPHPGVRCRQRRPAGVLGVRVA